jgi:hypothetical protein
MRDGSAGRRSAVPAASNGVEHRAAGAVADRVDRDREPAAERARDVALQRVRRNQLHAAVLRAVVGLEQRGGLGAQRPVGEQLHCPDAEHRVAAPARHAVRERAVEPGVRQVHEHAPRADPRPRTSRAAGAPRPRLEVVHRRDPEREQPRCRAREQRPRRARAPLPASSAANSRTAFSRMTPLGAPEASCSIRPPGGSGVVRPTPAASSAAPFTHSAWKSWLWSSTGRSGHTASSAARCGASLQRFASQPRPITGPLPGWRAAKRANARRRVGCGGRARERDVHVGARPLHDMDVGVRDPGGDGGAAGVDHLGRGGR